MVDASETKCPHCGANIKEWWHTLTPGLVNCFLKAVVFVKQKNKNRFHLQRDLNFTKTEYNNFQKLRYFGICVKCEDSEGYWLITKLGGQFLKGQVALPRRVRTFRNRIVGKDNEIVSFREMSKKVPRFEEDFEFIIRDLISDPVKNDEAKEIDIVKEMQKLTLEFGNMDHVEISKEYQKFKELKEQISKLMNLPKYDGTDKKIKELEYKLKQSESFLLYRLKKL